MITGELLAILDTGAYVSSMASNYNMRPRVWEVMVNGNQAEIIAKRESFENMLNIFKHSVQLVLMFVLVELRYSII